MLLTLSNACKVEINTARVKNALRMLAFSLNKRLTEEISERSHVIYYAYFSCIILLGKANN